MFWRNGQDVSFVQDANGRIILFNRSWEWLRELSLVLRGVCLGFLSNALYLGVLHQIEEAICWGLFCTMSLIAAINFHRRYHHENEEMILWLEQQKQREGWGQFEIPSTGERCEP